MTTAPTFGTGDHPSDASADTTGTADVPDTDPTLSQLTARATAIPLPTEPADIMAALLRIGGDIAHALPAAEQGDPEAFADLEREFGNLILSGLRWAATYVHDPATSIDAAEQAQQAYAERGMA